RRPLSAPRLHRGRDLLLYAPPRAGHSLRRPVRRQGSSDEGARHRPIAERPVARRRSPSTGRTAATAVARRRGAAIQRDWRTIVAAQHHAFRRTGDGSGPAARRLTATLVVVFDRGPRGDRPPMADSAS